MKNAVLASALLFAALGARAEMPQMLGNDPLSREILTKTMQANGGVTAAVRVSGSSQGIVLKLADVSAPFTAHMAPAAESPALALKTAEGLIPKPRPKKRKRKPYRHVIDQLKHSVKKWGG